MPTEIPDSRPVCAGAIRIVADMVMLSRASVLLGSCGSTFSHMAHTLASPSPRSVLDPSTRVAWCTPPHFDEALSAAFAWKRITAKEEGAHCGCYYEEGEPRDRGSCAWACSKTGRTPPALCPAVDPELFERGKHGGAGGAALRRQIQKLLHERSRTGASATRENHTTGFADLPPYKNKETVNTTVSLRA